MIVKCIVLFHVDQFEVQQRFLIVNFWTCIRLFRTVVTLHQLQSYCGLWLYNTQWKAAGDQQGVFTLFYQTDIGESLQCQGFLAASQTTAWFLLLLLRFRRPSLITELSGCFFWFKWSFFEIRFLYFFLSRFLSFFLFWVSKTQPNHWTKGRSEPNFFPGSRLRLG